MKSGLSLAAAAAITAILSGQADAQSPLHTWRHGVLEPKSDSGFILMATTQAFAAKYGIDLKIVPVKSDNLGLRALISGDVDSYEGPPPFAAIIRGADVKEIGCPWVGTPHVVFARSNIARVSDLDGKTMATSAPGSLPDLVGRALLDNAKIPPDHVRLANVGSDADRYRSLLGGVVDAAVISSEYTPVVDLQKVHVLAVAADVVPDFLRICYQTTAKTIADRPDDVARFLATEMDALRFALAHKDETIKLAIASTGQKPDDPRPGFMFDEIARTHPIDPTLPVPTDKLASMQATLIKLGVLTKSTDIATMIDTKPRERALTLVGK